MTAGIQSIPLKWQRKKMHQISPEIAKSCILDFKSFDLWAKVCAIESIGKVKKEK